MRLFLGCGAGVEQLGLGKPKTFVWWLNVRMTQLKFLMSYAVRKLNQRVACPQRLTATALSRTACDPCADTVKHNWSFLSSASVNSLELALGSSEIFFLMKN